MSITKDINDMMDLLKKLRDQIVAKDLEITKLNVQLNKVNERLKTVSLPKVIGVFEPDSNAYINVGVWFASKGISWDHITKYTDALKAYLELNKLYICKRIEKAQK